MKERGERREVRVRVRRRSTCRVISESERCCLVRRKIGKEMRFDEIENRFALEPVHCVRIFMILFVFLFINFRGRMRI